MTQRTLFESKAKPRTTPAGLKTVRFKIDRELGEKAKAVAMMKGCQLGDVVSEAIGSYLEEGFETDEEQEAR